MVNSSDERRLKEFERFFHDLSKKLAKTPWFKKGKWLASYHRFPNINPEAVTFHVFKKHWYNDDTRGIHFETFLSLKHPSTTSVTLHILHTPTIPGTNIKRTEISKPFVDQVLPLVTKWKGYKLKSGKYGMQFFNFPITINHETLSPVLRNEFERLCSSLGDPLDQAIKSALKS